MFEKGYLLRVVIIVAILVLAASIIAGCGGKKAFSIPPTTLSSLSGEVLVSQEGSAGWTEASEGMELEVGDCVKTGPDGQALMLFFEGSVMEMEQDTQLCLEELNLVEDTGSTFIKIWQQVGRTINRVEQLTDPASRYEVETPAGSSVVRGTIIEVVVEEDGTTTSKTISGEALFCVEEEEDEEKECVLVPLGWEITVLPGGSLGEPTLSTSGLPTPPGEETPPSEPGDENGGKVFGGGGGGGGGWVPTPTPTPPEISYSPSSITFTATEGDANPADQTLGIFNSGGGSLDWSVSDDAGWLSLDPPNGSSTGETDDVTLSVDITSMSAGSYSATITIEAPGATNTPQTVPVSLTINPPAPTISYSPSSITFTATEGDANPADQTLGIFNSGGGSLDWSVSDDAGWLSLAPPSGTSTGETDDVTLSVDITSMSAGSYSATITIAAPGATNTPQTVPVSLTINPPAPTIYYSPSSITFTATEGDANPASKSLWVKNDGGGSLDWSVSDDAGWLSLAPPSGTSTGEMDGVTLSVDITGMSAGSYSATITIAAPGATNTPQTVPVSLTINPAPRDPEIWYNPVSFSFYANAGGINPASKSLWIRNNGGGSLDWSVSDDAGWLSLAPPSGTSTGEMDEVTLSVDITGMSVGSYSATITIAAPGATNTPRTVPVSLTINPALGPPEIWYDPTSFSFYANEGGINPASKSLWIRNNGGGSLDWSVSDDAGWLSLAPPSGSSTGEMDEVTLSVDITGMSAGSYSATITIAAPGASNTPRTVPVNLTIYPPVGPPEIWYNPMSFSFYANEGDANPASKSLWIRNDGGGSLDWSVSDDAGWLSLAPPSGSSTGEMDEVTLSVDITGMSAGSYSATITIAAPGATNTPRTVPVSLTIYSPPKLPLTLTGIPDVVCFSIIIDSITGG